MIFGPYRAVVVDEHDGDTIFVDVLLRQSRRVIRPPDLDLGFHVHLRRDGYWLARQSVRTFSDNAPELNTPEGVAALAYLKTILAVGDHVELLSRGWDKYGRILGTVTLSDGRDLTQAMITAGQAVWWDGKGNKP